MTRAWFTEERTATYPPMRDMPPRKETGGNKGCTPRREACGRPCRAPTSRPGRRRRRRRSRRPVQRAGRGRSVPTGEGLLPAWSSPPLVCLIVLRFVLTLGRFRSFRHGLTLHLQSRTGSSHGFASATPDASPAWNACVIDHFHRRARVRLQFV